MPRRATSLSNISDLAIAREIDSKYDAVKAVSLKLYEIELITEMDIDGLITQLNEALDFEGITVVAGVEASWNPTTKVLTVPTLQGETGLSAYEEAILDGFVGTEVQWLASLIGAQGAQGETGLTGEQGIQGPQGIQGIQGETGLTGATGNGIASVALTNTVGDTKTYTITFTDTSTTTFDVVDGTDGINGTNGTDGQDVDHVTRTIGTGAAGTTDTYTVWGDLGETINLGTFTVYNGTDGTGAGDMTKAVYDPTNISASAFDTDNHVSGITNKVYTATEQTKVSNLSGTNTGDQDLSGYSITTHSHTLDGLSDIAITTPTSGQVLSYTGTEWVNTLPSVDETDPVFVAWKTTELPLVAGGDTIKIVNDRTNLLFKWYVNDVFVKNIPWGWDAGVPAQVVDANWTLIGSSEISTNIELIFTGLVDADVKNYKFDFSGALLNISAVAVMNVSVHNVTYSIEYLGWQIGGGSPSVSDHLYFNTDDLTAVATGLTYTASTNTAMLKSTDIGTTVQGYNAGTTTAGNVFNGVSQLVKTDALGKLPVIDGSQLTNLPSATLDTVPTDGSTNGVQSNGVYDALVLKSDATHNHTGVYEPADATILKDVDIGVSVEAYDSTILKDADIGVSVQGYDANITTAGNTFNGVSQLVQTDGTGKLPAIDGSLLTNLPSGGTTASSLLAEHIQTGASATSVTISNLDILTDKSYVIHLELKNSSGASCFYNLFYNGITTVGDYYTSRYVVGTETFEYSAWVLDATSNGYAPVGQFTIVKDPDGRPSCNGTGRRNSSNGGRVSIISQTYIIPVTNITSISIVASATDGIGINSKIRVYKV